MEGNSFTEDLLTEIISRVSAKDLVRFTCVSKSWCSLIRTDPYFSRLQRTSSPYRPCLYIEEIFIQSGIVQCVPASCLFNNYWVDLDSVDDQRVNLIEIHNPFVDDDDRPLRDARVFATCHDFIVLGRPDCLMNKIAVSNPVTRKHVIVPPNSAGDDNVVFFGFGYDRIHDCYKLLTRVKHGDNRLDLMVYDLDKGTWKGLQFGMWWKSQFGNMYGDRYSVHLYCNWDDCNPKCVDGALYWFFDLEIPRKKRMMVCFLLAEEEFHVVKPPGLGRDIMFSFNSMTVFDGKLCLERLGLSTRLEFWTVDIDYVEDGKRQWRWSKLLEIPGAPNFMVSRIPVCFSPCKNKILILSSDGNQLSWYDRVKKRLNKLSNPIYGPCEEGQFFCWYDMVKKVHKKFHKLNNPIDGRCSDVRSYAGIEII